MKRIALAAALFVSAITAAHANDTIVRSNNQASISIGAHNLNYRELDAYGVTGTNELDSEKGAQFAVNAAITRQGEVLGFKDIYTSASLTYSHGNTDYNGYLQNLATGELSPYKNKTKNSTTDFSLKVGKGFSLGDHAQFQVTPYASYGFHNWVRDMEGDYGYKETYSHHTVGAGVLGQYAVTNKLVLSADYSVGKTLNPSMKTDDFGDFRLQSRGTQQVALGVDYALTRQLHINGAYRLTHFRYGESGQQNGFMEPRSRTTENVFLVGLGYAY